MLASQFVSKCSNYNVKNIERYLVVKYKKWSIPFSIFILTLIGFSVAAEKRRGGTGVNLAFGICVAMVYVFFDKIFVH